MKKLKNSELNRIDVKSFKAIKKTPLIVVLDNIRSLNNIGSIFRTCDAFLVSKIYLCGITAKPPNRKINKTALGSTDSVEWDYFKSTIKLIEKLKSEGVKIWSIEQVERAQKLNYIEKIDSKLKHAIVFGNEITGVDQKIIDISENTIEIDQYGTKHSLNVSVAAGIVIWKFYNLSLIHI